LVLVLASCAALAACSDRFDKGGGSKCNPGLDSCGSACVDFNSDPDNCGSCGNACPAAQGCGSGQCLDSCPTGLDDCNRACVDLNTDPFNCGACGSPCGKGQVCAGGQCGQTCPSGTEKCGSNCVDTQSDAQNCGACGKPCALGQVCSGGNCQASCGAGQSECNGICVDTQSNAQNCGSCGKACSAGQTCSSGSCTVACSGGQVACSGLCYDLQTDPNHCGDCTTQCKSGEVCSNGSCALNCQSGQTACSGACVDLQISATHCGTCGKACGQNEQCSAGKCVSANLGLDFPGSKGTVNTMRFKFTNPLPVYPATYIWRAWPRQQNGYYTAFFWGNDDGGGTLSTFLWTSNGGADTYYGAHPYPDVPPDGSTHQWEISIEQQDFVNGAVIYNRWYTQALRVWVGSDGRKHHEFYWDLPNTDSNHRVIRISDPGWGNVNPPVPALTWGDAPWNPGKEVWDGILRGIQIYTSSLSLADILSETSTPLSTAAGSASIWYLNLNPTPGDIADRSGKSHDPIWVGSERPALWMGP